ncbi:MAG: antibiotic biosynthesis monooxygenase family protein [bacterium]|nr:antibiotic biosynthesis monooxygenase [Gammaproteobacteria bacterium]HIL97522.1 antibiotic biosynthesis monooxygenase [Pseudomonadales bacterium]
MTTILAHIEIRPGKEEKFEAIMKDMVTSTFASETGVNRYEYFKGQKQNFYYCLLSFADKWAFYRHQNSDHHEGHDFGDVLQNIRLEYLDPVEDANPLPPTI